MPPQRREYISDLQVKYGDSSSDAPANALRELTGLSNAINHRFGGAHVWLVPTYTTDANAAATAFHVVVQNQAVAGMDDLARGTGGGYRYVFAKSDPDEPRKITHAVLLRSTSAVAKVPPGWDAISGDLNKGRRKSYLYILMKTVGGNGRENDVEEIENRNSSRLSVALPNVSGYLSVRNSAAPKEYVQALDVVYGDDDDGLPSDCIREINGLDSSLNFSGNGKAAWLVPRYTNDPSKAATSFDVLIQPFEDPKHDNLAKRAGGDFRYVLPRADRKLSEKITEVGLLRSDKPISKPPAGWQGYCINDLSKGRQKGCLYVVWRSVSTNSWSFVSLPSILAPSRSSNGINKLIKSLKVCYGDEEDDEPEDAVYEFYGQSADLNHQFGGKYAWLVPEYTTDPHAAATSFDVSIQRIADLNFADIAKGSHGGKFRYIVPVHDPTERSKVKEVQLLRSAGVVRSPPVGWTGMSRDMNEGRGRSCLYLLWKS